MQNNLTNNTRKRSGAFPARRLWLLLGIACFSAVLSAQTITIGTANQTEMPPIKSNHNYSYTQQLYFQNEINQSGQITAIRFYFYGAGGVTPTSLSNSNNWTVYMGHTTATSLSVGSFQSIGGMTQVYSGSLPANPAIGWITITLQTPFTYNNINNLIIAVDENTSGNNGGTGNDWASVSIPGGPSRQLQAYGTSDINPASPPGPNIAFAGMPYTQLVFGTPPPCVSAPTSPADFSTLCGSQHVTLSWPASPGATSYVVLIDNQPNLTAANIVGTVSGTSYTTAATLGTGTWYWAIIPQNSSGAANNCFIWEFYIDPIPVGDKFANPIIISSLPYTASSNNITSLTCYVNDFGQPSPDIFYRFTTTACNSRVDISLCGQIVFNNYLHLLNSAGTTIATNDDNGPLCSGIAASLRMDNLPAGTYYIVVEGSGSATGPYTLNVTASDITAPTITCPANITTSSAYNYCGEFVTFANATATDNCPAPVVTNLGQASGTLFPVGTTNVTFRATDGSNNSNTCSFSITVNDVHAPQYNCPANITQPNTPGTCGRLVSWTGTIIDNCPFTVSHTVIQGLFSGSVFPVGTTTNVLQATDGAGNTGTCSFTVTINDTEAPTISCPSNIMKATDPNVCNAVVTFSNAVASDNCTGTPPAITQIGGSVSGSSFNTGTSTITFRATDAAGNSSTCSFTVTVTDSQVPVINCPGTQTIVANASCQAEMPNYLAVITASDNCTANPYKTQSPGPGTTLNSGNHTVTLMATDGAGNTGTCTFTVSVPDQTPPSVTCPGPQTVVAGPSCSTQIVSYIPMATSSDNCAGGTPYLTQIPPPTTTISGNVLVTLTAHDGAGNTNTCTFNVTVTDQTPPSITCPATQTVAANASCQATLANYTSLATATDNCTASPLKSQSPVAGTTLNIGNTLLTLTAADAAGNSSSCTFNVVVSDQTAPSITCPANLTVNNNPATACSATATYTIPSASDNCGIASTIQIAGLASGATFPVGVTTNTWRATDVNGNTNTCSFTVQVNDVTTPSISCPSNITVNNNPATACSATVTYAPPLALDNCGIASTIQTAGLASGATFPVGVTTNTWRTTDLSGNTQTCSFIVQVNDVTAPSITCPANTTVNNNPATACSATVTYAPPLALDNCGITSTVQIAGLASGATFPVGATTNTWRTTDQSGNTGTCSFIVQVNDVTAPSISCPANVTVNNNPATACSATVTYAPPLALDNCGIASTVQTAGLSSGATFPVGATSNTWRTTDVNGNSSTCSFIVQVNDVTAPSITCPANTTVNNNPATACSATVTYAPPLALDNCGIASTVQTAGLASGATFPVGATTNTWRTTDVNGNTTTCSFIVQVNDVTAPSISCPANIIVSNSPSNACSATVTYAPPLGLDNCGITSTVLTAGLASGASFPVGVTANTWRTTDLSGNTATCSFTVMVRDIINPVITCPANQTINASANCTGTLGAWTPVSMSDNCSPAPVFTQSPIASTILSGHNDTRTVALMATDANGNTASCTFTVTLKDVTLPVAKCKNATVNLGSNGVLTLPPATIDNISTDNCTFSLSVTPNTFGCANLGNNTVILRATDAAGNSSTCTAVVTLRDLTAPTALCKTANVFLDEIGRATITPAVVNNNSSDACGIATMTINNSQFDCGQIGGSPVLVQLTVKDQNNNTATCMANVYVKDNLPPTAVCTNTTVALSASGYASVATAPLAANSYDNCSVTSYSPVAKVYTSANLGVNNLTITVKDWSGNGATCVSQVTVLPYGSNFKEAAPAGGTSATEESFVLGGRLSLDLSLFPNPTAGESTLVFELNEEQPYNLRLFDLNGRLVMNNTFEGFKGENTIGLELGELEPGLYLIDVQSGSWHGQKKLVLQR